MIPNQILSSIDPNNGFSLTQEKKIIGKSAFSPIAKPHHYSMRSSSPTKETPSVPKHPKQEDLLNSKEPWTSDINGKP